MAQPTERQRQVLAFIRRYSAEHGRSPTMREIRQACRLSSTSVAAHAVAQLQAAGLIVRDGNLARGIRLVGSRLVAPGDVVPVEIDGRVVEARVARAEVVGGA